MATRRISGNKYIINGLVADTSEFIPDPATDVYYEVIRLIDGNLLFLDNHLQRLRRSLSQSGIVYPGDTKIIQSLAVLLKNNDLKEGNIRICLQRTHEQQPALVCYFVPYFYPDESMYDHGVKLVSYPHERPNPGIKKWDSHFREAVQEHIRNHGVYEAVLLNDKGEFTEGSRSNLFFIDANDRLITPPETVVLPGITRRYVLDICRIEGIEVLERTVSINELRQLVSCFISGTSPKVLPVKKLDAIPFSVDHSLLSLIMKEFDYILRKNLKTIV